MIRHSSKPNKLKNVNTEKLEGKTSTKKIFTIKKIKVIAHIKNFRLNISV